jgi:UDP-N-acetyl-D-glucosamine dehydrogenase
VTNLRKLQKRDATVGVIGLGYVGLPLVLLAADAGFRVIGLDIDPAKVAKLNAGRSYIKHIPAAKIRALGRKRFRAATDFRLIRRCDVILICVPTPLTEHMEPDMKYIADTGRSMAPHLRRGQLVVLESTTYPGTTEEFLRPILETSGLKAGRDFFLAFSPEREDPGNPTFHTRVIPKVVGGLDRPSLEMACAFYGRLVDRVVPVSSMKVAESCKLLENIFRSVNIALVNELKILFTRMGIDVWEVIRGASTKPFGFMPFYPGPGLGGHCIPIDPFYLSWKAKEYDLNLRFVELAGEVNIGMPYYVVDRLQQALDVRGRTLKGAKVLLLGMAYKKNVDDIRESPALKIWEILEDRGAKVRYHDPYIPVLPTTRKYPHSARSRALTPALLRGCDAVVIVTGHDAVDYRRVARHAPLVVDSRHVVKGRRRNVVKA